MQSTLLEVILFPPPAPSTDVFPGGDRAGTGRAADAGVTPFMKGVMRYVEIPDVVPDLSVRPVDHRVELVDLMGGVPFAGLEVGSMRRLLAPQSGQPCLAAGKRPVE